MLEFGSARQRDLALRAQLKIHHSSG
jgi:hypothetical protein